MSRDLWVMLVLGGFIGFLVGMYVGVGVALKQERKWHEYDAASVENARDRLSE